MQLKLGNLWSSAARQRLAGEYISRLERARASDEAIVSFDATGQHNPTPSQGPLDRTVCRAGFPRPPSWRLLPRAGLPWKPAEPTLAAYKPETAKVAVEGRFEAVLGKTRRTEFQRGRRKRDVWPDDHLPRSPKGRTQRKSLAYALARLLSTRRVTGFRNDSLRDCHAEGAQATDASCDAEAACIRGQVLRSLRLPQDDTQHDLYNRGAQPVGFGFSILVAARPRHSRPPAP
jgi:hypothetical protein